jgi:hypothetical protein
VDFSTAVIWGLYALGCNPIVHAKLNAEARAFHTDTPSMDELNEMTYLDHFTREVLRLYAPVSQTDRVAKEDTVVRVGEPYVDRHGVTRHEIKCVVYRVAYLIELTRCHGNTKAAKGRRSPHPDSLHTQIEIVVGRGRGRVQVSVIHW